MENKIDFCLVYKQCFSEVVHWFNIFHGRFPLDTTTVYYQIDHFIIMLYIVHQQEKQFGGKPFKVCHGFVEKDCIHYFHRQFCFRPFFNYMAILREWITRYKIIKFNKESKEDFFKKMPFSEELIFVLFNFFATHGKCLTQCNV